MPPKTVLNPRKTPIQVRSTQTVEAIFDACIQVLLSAGPDRLTTTRVAERAGVSVGTLYQYFPNKHALLAAVLKRHLLQVVEAVERACSEAKGQPVSVMAKAVVEAFMEAKFHDPEASHALYAVAAEVEGNEVVIRLTQRVQLALCEMLATASDVHFEQLATVSYLVSTAVIGPTQGLLTAQTPPPMVEATRAHLELMLSAYLKAAGTSRGVASD